MKYRNIQPLLQTRFYLKAARRGDILKIYPAEAVGDKLNGAHYFVGILAFYTKRDSIHPAELLEQAALALHNRHTRQSSDIAKTQHRRAVRYYRNKISPPCQLIGKLGVLRYFKTGLRHSRSICQRQIFFCFDFRTGNHLQLTLPLIMLF